MQDNSYGFDVNLTVVTNDFKNFDAGVKMTSSDGFKFDRAVRGASVDDVCEKISGELEKEYTQYLDSLVSIEGNSVEDRLKRLEMENERLRQELVAAKAKKGGEPDRAESVGTKAKMPEHKKPSRVKMDEDFGKELIDLLKMFV